MKRFTINEYKELIHQSFFEDKNIESAKKIINNFLDNKIYASNIAQDLIKLSVDELGDFLEIAKLSEGEELIIGCFINWVSENIETIGYYEFWENEKDSEYTLCEQGSKLGTGTKLFDFFGIFEEAKKRKDKYFEESVQS